MKQFYSVFFLLLLSNLFAFGQKYNFLPDKELAVINALFVTIKDTDIVISPLIKYSSIDSEYIKKDPELKKYGFYQEQLNQVPQDSFLLDSKLFEVVDLDFLQKYEGVYSIELPDNKILFEPLFYYLKEEYQKSGVCYFYKPVFSKNGRYAISKYYINCGSLCGYGETVLMKNNGLKWKVFAVLVRTMS